MLAHIRSCQLCAAHDARIRRALLLVWNIRQVEPAEDFQARLFRRIQDEQQGWTRAGAGPSGPTVGTFAAAAVSLIVIGAMAIGVGEWRGRPTLPPRLPAVIALAPATLDSATAPALVAAMSAGMAVWPALWLAEEAPFRYVSEVSRYAHISLQQP